MPVGEKLEAGAGPEYEQVPVEWLIYCETGAAELIFALVQAVKTEKERWY